MTPPDRASLIEALRDASSERRTLAVRGGGSHGRRGHVVPAPDATLSTLGLRRVIDHAPADLTVTVEGGARVDALTELLASEGQRWPQVDPAPGATVGGAIAAGASGRLRLRHGPIRDGVLEIVIATGDGRLGTAGGRTVKGVAGYDLPRLMTGALGTLGVVVQATLKLWPVPPAAGWFVMEGDLEARLEVATAWMRDLVRPAAVLLRPDGAWLHLEGPPDDVVAPATARPAAPPPGPTGTGMLSVGVPPPAVTTLVRALAAAGDAYEAQVGVGACRVVADTADDVARIREIATGLGGHAWVADGPDVLREDPWGPAPGGLDVMRRLKAAFDPAGILSPGIGVGGI